MKPEIKNTKRELCSLDVFGGVGGLALGIARAGFSTAAVIDCYAPACETLRLNKRNCVEYVRDWEVIESDVREVDFRSYHGEIDLLSGGPPCQPFSQAGKMGGRTDDRDMFPQFVRAVREVEPKAFIIENVKGLLSRRFCNYFNYVIHQLRFPLVKRKHREKWTEHRARLEKHYTGNTYRGVQYKVIWQVLNATDFGVAQRRERVFIVGIRADIGAEYAFPLASHSKDALYRDQWITSTYWDRHGIATKYRAKKPEFVERLLPRLKKRREEAIDLPWRTVRDAISDLPRVAVGGNASGVSNHFLNPGARKYDGHSGSHLDSPGKTIKAGYHGVPGGENMVRLDDGSLRYFSVRECARLQSFPDDWTLEGSWSGCMRQLGNAVPVSVAEAVATPLAKVLAKRRLKSA